MNFYDSFVEEHVVETSATQKQFWNAVNLWNERPNIVNKKLIGIEMITKFQIKNIEYIDNVINILRIIIEGTDVLISKTITERLKASCNDYLYFNNDNEIDICFYVKKLLPKILNLKMLTEVDVAIFDYINNKATFFNIFSMTNTCIETNMDDNINYEKLYHYCYQITFKEFLHHNELKDITLSHISLSFGNQISHYKNTCISNFNNNKEWLKNKLLCKIVKWSEEGDESNNNQIDEKSTSVCKSGSLRLISINEYCFLYQKLKKMYGKKFVKIWPENTDPLKFVYEDVAIATYLLLLWGDKKQKFVDMGCGNGLLVHILTCEGHVGIGFDVRSRKIWELYPSGTADLQVKTIVPTVDGSCLYPDVDWLIGNHSDELTPWIPVIASLSSYKCNYFLLPCCSYELNGQKYQRQNSSKSQYMDYLDYISSLCGQCGFNYEFDKLRIPSTKRICIVSCGRNYSESDHELKVSVVRDLVKYKCCSSDHININDSEKNNVYDNFKTRSSEIKVRNCTQLDKNFVEDLVILISKKLLIPSLLDEDDNIIKTMNCNNNKNVWNEGHPIKLNELAKSIPGEYLKQLKKECGGLQTLIKNHHYIFKIDKGMVCFRKPLKSNKNVSKSFISKSNKVITIRNREANLKKKICWFYKNHPDKCPLNNDECQFIHS